MKTRDEVRAGILERVNAHRLIINPKLANRPGLDSIGPVLEAVVDEVYLLVTEAAITCAIDAMTPRLKMSGDLTPEQLGRLQQLRDTPSRALIVDTEKCSGVYADEQGALRPCHVAEGCALPGCRVVAA